MGTRTRFPPLPPLSLPPFRSRSASLEDLNTVYTGSIIEIPECDSPANLDLGAELPDSILETELVSTGETNVNQGNTEHLGDKWRKAGIAVHTDIPPRKRNWRSASWERKRCLDSATRASKPYMDKDCGICFELAVKPCRMECCGRIFCLDHICDWLYGSSSDGRCPSCETPSSRLSRPPSRLSLHPSPPPEVSPSDSHSRPSQSLTTHDLALRRIPVSTHAPVTVTSSHHTPAPPDDEFGQSSSFKSRSDWIRNDSEIPKLDSPLSPLSPEVIGKILSIVGLTLILYVIFA